jgi:putative two-component system response regulator
MDTIIVLAVDDLDLNLRIMRDVLKDLGDIEILEARNGREALSCLAQRPAVDIVLLDLEMPVMNGYETLRYLKIHERFREIPVIVVTSEKSEVKKILEMGANDFMAKPFDPEELKLRVMNHVRSKKLGDLARDMTGVLEK